MTCEHTNENFLKFCTTCGDKIDRLICSCGFANTLDSSYCGNCGKNISEFQHIKLEPCSNPNPKDNSRDFSMDKKERKNRDKEKYLLSEFLNDPEVQSSTIESSDATATQDDIERMFQGKLKSWN